MTIYYPELDAVLEILESIPHYRSQSLANAIRVCSKVKKGSVTKACAVLKIIR